MGQFYDSGFVVADSLAWVAYPGALQLTGQIACQSGVVISVEKTLNVDSDDDPVVVTTDYTYNAHVSGHASIVRNDNTDHHGHPDPHHVHRYDWRTGNELAGSPEHVGADGWPTLGEFIEAMREWCAEHHSELPATPGRLNPDYGPRALVASGTARS